jgi:hypothetical protein
MPLQVAISAFRSLNITDQRRGEWLREALTRSLSLQPEAEAVRARRVIFDALIRTRTPVPLTELLPFFDQFPAAVIAIVAKNNPREGEDRLPLLLKAKNSLYWYAAVKTSYLRDVLTRLFDLEQSGRAEAAVELAEAAVIQHPQVPALRIARASLEPPRAAASSCGPSSDAE